MASRFYAPITRGVDPLLTLYREMNRMFDDVLGGGVSAPATGRDSPLMAMPSLDIQEKDNQLQISVELPGVRAEDVDVRLDRDVLTISGEKRSESESKPSHFHVTERSYGRFSRSMQLPFLPNPSDVTADFEHGVLKIRLKRNEQQQTSQRIEVRSAPSEPKPVTTDQPNAPSSSDGGAGETGPGGLDLSAHYGAGRDAAPPAVSSGTNGTSGTSGANGGTAPSAAT